MIEKTKVYEEALKSGNVLQVLHLHHMEEAVLLRVEKDGEVTEILARVKGYRRIEYIVRNSRHEQTYDELFEAYDVFTELVK